MISNELLARSLKTQLEKSNHLIQNSFELRQRSQCCKQGWELVGATAPCRACSTRAGLGMLETVCHRIPELFWDFPSFYTGKDDSHVE